MSISICQKCGSRLCSGFARGACQMLQSNDIINNQQQRALTPTEDWQKGQQQNHKCEEDFNGNCYWCGKSMVESNTLLETRRTKNSKPPCWTRKGVCPSCGVKTGSHHNKMCKLEYKKFIPK